MLCNKVNAKQTSLKHLTFVHFKLFSEPFRFSKLVNLSITSLNLFSSPHFSVLSLSHPPLIPSQTDCSDLQLRRLTTSIELLQLYQTREQIGLETRGFNSPFFVMCVVEYAVFLSFFEGWRCESSSREPLTVGRGSYVSLDVLRSTTALAGTDAVQDISPAVDEHRISTGPARGHKAVTVTRCLRRSFGLLKRETCRLNILN